MSRGWLHKFKQMGRRVGKNVGCDPKGTSAGACAITSHQLYKTLRKKGKDVNFVVGHYNDDGDSPESMNSHEVNHAWIEQGDKVVDITHNQFGQSHDKRRRPIGPAVVVTNKTDSRYTPWLRNKSAEHHVKHNWDSSQNITKGNLRKLKQYGIKEMREGPNKWWKTYKSEGKNSLKSFMKTRSGAASQAGLHKKAGEENKAYAIEKKIADHYKFDVRKRKDLGPYRDKYVGPKKKEVKECING